MKICDNCKSHTTSPTDTLRMIPAIVERQSDDVTYDQSLEECLREMYMTHETMQGDRCLLQIKDTNHSHYLHMQIATGIISSSDLHLLTRCIEHVCL